MTIINATQYLKQLHSSSELNRIGKFTGFCQRLRDIQPARLLPALLSGLGCDKVDGIAGYIAISIRAAARVWMRQDERAHKQLSPETGFKNLAH
jgi:hypothetical protein